MLHIVNSFEIPVSFMKSYSWYAGVQDALVQWWYGHNAVAFFLTTPILGLMYYFLAQGCQPAGIFVPAFHHSLLGADLYLYLGWSAPSVSIRALPDWAQSLGTVFSIMLIAPSWGGMLNGLFTLRGAWDKVREDPILKFMVVAITCYGMATLEGPMLSLKKCKRHRALYRLDHCARAYRRPRLERLYGLWYALLPGAQNVGYATVFKKTSQ